MISTLKPPSIHESRVRESMADVSDADTKFSRRERIQILLNAASGVIVEGLDDAVLQHWADVLVCAHLFAERWRTTRGSKLDRDELAVEAWLTFGNEYAKWLDTGLPDYRPRLMQIMENKARQLMKSFWRRLRNRTVKTFTGSETMEILVAEDVPDDFDVFDTQVAVLNTVFKGLPRRDLEIMYCFHGRDMSYAAIAERYKMSEGNCRRVGTDTLKKVREKAKELGITVSMPAIMAALIPLDQCEAACLQRQQVLELTPQLALGEITIEEARAILIGSSMVSRRAALAKITVGTVALAGSTAAVGWWFGSRPAGKTDVGGASSGGTQPVDQTPVVPPPSPFALPENPAPGTRFEMLLGSPKTAWAFVWIPQNAEGIGGFWMSETELTQAQFKSMNLRGGVNGGPLNPSQFKGDQRPVERVTVPEALECLRFAAAECGHRLRFPTRKEFFHAATCGGTQPMPSDAAMADKFAWYDGNGGGTSHDVKTKAANNWGLYDMAGNVYDLVTNGGEYQVCGGNMGESIEAMSENDQRGWLPENRFSWQGFRLVLQPAAM